MNTSILFSLNVVHSALYCALVAKGHVAQSESLRTNCPPIYFMNFECPYIHNIIEIYMIY